MSILEFLQQSFTFALSSGLAIGLFLFVCCCNAARWRLLARHYVRDWGRPGETRTMQSGVMYGQGACNTYQGILKIGVDQNGVSLAIIRPFSFFYFCEPLFIPYSEIKGWQQQWYLDLKSVELEFARVPEVKMVMPADQVEWMRKRSGLQMTVRSEPTPHKDKPVFWYYFAILQGGLALGVVAWIIFDSTLL